MMQPNDLHAAPQRTEAAPSRNGSGNLSDRVRSLRLADHTSGTSPRGSALPWTLCVVLAVVALAFGYRAYRVTPAVATSDTAGEVDADKSASSSLPSATSASSGEVVLEAKGYVTPVHSIQISPQVGGEIIFLDANFKEGAFYKKGDVLAKIDPVIFEAQLKSAQAALQVAKTNLTQVETGSTLNDLETARAQQRNLAAKLELSKLDERYNIAARTGVARQDMERSTAQVNIDQTAYNVQKEMVTKLEVSLEEQRQVARAQVATAEANVQQAAKQLKNCIITAPTTGIILTKKAELGGYVNPLAFGAAGYLCEMADLTDIEVEVMVQEREVAGIFVGQKCTVMPEAFQRDEAFLKKYPTGYVGAVSRLMPTADRSKGAIPVRVKVPVPVSEAAVYLKPDMSTSVSFRKKTEE